MAVDGNVITLPGAIAGEDLRNHQFRFVSLQTTASAAYTVLKSAAVGAIGVSYGNPNTGQAAEVVIGGIAKVIAGAAIVRGANVDSDANGAAVTTASTRMIALTAAAAAGEVIEVLLSR
jgi:hypothetical protein